MQKVVLIKILNVRQLDQVDVNSSMRSLGCISKLNEELLVHLVFIFLGRTLKIHHFERMLLEREQSLFFDNIWVTSTRNYYLTHILGGYDVKKQSIAVELFGTSDVK